MRVFKDRHDAGAQLARALYRFADAPDVAVLALTRESVPVAYEVAMRLALPLDVVSDDYDGELVTIDVVDKTILLLDDGDAAREMPIVIEQLRRLGAAMIVAAIGVSSPQICMMLRAAADHSICVLSPQHIYAVQAWFADFEPPSEDEVRQLLVAAAQNLLVSGRSQFLSAVVDT